MQCARAVLYFHLAACPDFSTPSHKRHGGGGKKKKKERKKERKKKLKKKCLFRFYTKLWSETFHILRGFSEIC